MSVRQEGGGDTQRFMCTSSEDKPLGDMIQDGATLHIVDTGERYVYYEGMWETDLRNDPVAQVM